MTATSKLGLELLQNAAANQTLANLTFAQLNQLVQAAVVDKDLAAPPANPENEALYIVAASPTGAWAGRAGQLAYWLTTVGAWTFIPPYEGFFVHVNDEDAFYKYTGAAWEVFSGGGSAEDPTKLPLAGGTMTGALNEAGMVEVVAASNITASVGANANTWKVTGTATIAQISGGAGSMRRALYFPAAGSTLKHGIGNILLPGSADIVVRANDVAEFFRTPDDIYYLIGYHRGDGTPLVTPSDPNKVDKVTGLQLSQESYTTLEKAKLAGLDPNHFRGVFATLAALQAAVPTANAGDYANVDPASGTAVRQYLWDGNDNAWVDNGPTASLTAAQVKTLYEANPDTNGYTNAEKSKLGGVAAGATANANTDSLSEGAANLYFTAARVRAVILTGLSLAVGGAIAATDSVLSAMGKLQYQISNLTKANVGLGNVDNTADSAKPVSVAQQAALDAKAPLASPNFTGNTVVTLGNLTLEKTTGAPVLGLNANPGQVKQLSFRSGGLDRWRFACGAESESGSNAGSNFSIARCNDAGGGIDVPLVINRASGLVSLASLSVGGPARVGQYTLTTLPLASAFSGYEIDVTNATGGSKRCRSDGTVWQILNTTTTVS